MLPYFNVVFAKGNRRMSQEAPSKPRRKNLDVPVHNTVPEHQTYSANFNSRRKHKTVDFNDAVPKVPYEDVRLPLGNDNECSDSKPSRKSLQKEIEKLRSDNFELIEQLNNTETISTKKVAKLREKLKAVSDLNAQVTSENEMFKMQYEELIRAYDDLKAQLEEAQNCKSCHDLKTALENTSKDYNLLRTTNKELLEDISMLKNVVYRLNVQLEKYQESSRKTNPSHTSLVPHQRLTSEPGYRSTEAEIFTETHRDHSHVPVSWGKVNSHTLAPLLNAYEETITEKNEILENYEMEFARFTTALKEITKENEVLHKRLTEDERCSTKLSEELEKVRSELKGAKEQNDVLIKKCALKQDKVEEILKCYEKKVEQLQRDYKIVHEEYCKSRSEIVALKEKNKALIDSQAEFRSEKENYIPKSAHNASVNECKRLYEELKEQYENEKQKLKNSVTTLNDQIVDMNNKISVINSEKQDLENKIKALEKHIKKAETKYLDLQHNLNEIQLSRSACRKQLHKAMNFAKDLVAEQEALLKALNQRHMENKAVKMLGSDIANRMDSLKMQLKTVQRDAWQELETVEERLQKQDSLITAMKQEHSEEVERLREIIREKEKKIETLAAPDTNNDKSSVIL